MAFNFQDAFQKQKGEHIKARDQAATIKKARFDDAFKNITATIDALYAAGIPRELESPVSDWLEQFYEHGCVWMNEDLKRLADLWLNK